MSVVGSLSVLALLDLSDAFDTIDHTILLERGIDDIVLKWIRSYLSDGQQMVTVENYVSLPLPLKYGFPQGSVLGPLLFSLYVRERSDVSPYQCFPVPV